MSFLLPKADNAVAMEICNRVISMTNKIKVGHLCLSVALGHSTKDVIEQKFIDVMEHAENAMYNNKLLNAKSGRNEAVSSLLKTLYEMNYETEEHEQRLLGIATQVGVNLALCLKKLKNCDFLQFCTI